MFRPMIPAVVLAALVSTACSAPDDPPGPATYYVSASGDDSASGRAPDTAWRSLARATSQDLAPGDTVVLTGGRPLAGSLRLTAADGGDARDPVRITGDENFPGINAEGHAGIDITDTSGVIVDNLAIRVDDPGREGTNGVLVTASRGSGIHRGITLESITIEGAYQGVAVGAEQPGDGLRNVTVDRVRVTDAVRNGIITYGTPAPDFSLADVSITDSAVTGTRGIPGVQTNTGSGIVVGSADGALVEGNEASHNGALADAPEGPIGIWTHDSRDVVIRDNVSHHNQTQWTDGGGFGVDISTTDTLVERNLSHDNAGSGFLVYTRAGGLPTGRVTVRYNASVGDAWHDQLPAAMSVLGGLTSTDPGTFVHDIHVHHNTVIPFDGTESTALLLMGTVENLTVHHNIFDVSGGRGPAVRVSDWNGVGSLRFAANHLSADGGLLDREGLLVEEVGGLGDVFPGAAANVHEPVDYRDPGDLPRGLAPLRPLTADIPVPPDPTDAEKDLLGAPVTEPNPMIGAVSVHG